MMNGNSINAVIRYLPFFVIGCCAIAICSCKSTVPSATQIDAHQEVDPFISGASKIVGLQGNYDVDTIIFKYQTNSSKFWNDVKGHAENEGWVEANSPLDENEVHFQRVSKQGTEQVRVAFLPTRKIVVVAYLQSDSFKQSNTDSDSELDWADRNVWPDFNDFVRRERETVYPVQQ